MNGYTKSSFTWSPNSQGRKGYTLTLTNRMETAKIHSREYFALLCYEMGHWYSIILPHKRGGVVLFWIIFKKNLNFNTLKKLQITSGVFLTLYHPLPSITKIRQLDTITNFLMCEMCWCPQTLLSKWYPQACRLRRRRNLARQNLVYYWKVKKLTVFNNLFTALICL